MVWDCSQYKPSTGGRISRQGENTKMEIGYIGSTGMSHMCGVITIILVSPNQTWQNVMGVSMGSA